MIIPNNQIKNFNETRKQITNAAGCSAITYDFSLSNNQLPNWNLSKGLINFRIYIESTNESNGGVSIHSVSNIDFNNGFEVYDSLYIQDTIEYNGKKYNVIRIEQAAFANCKQFYGQVYFNNFIDEIPHLTFYGCENLKGTIIFPSNIKYIGLGAFQNCRKIEYFSFVSDRFTRLHYETFSGCDSLKKILINEKVFNECKKDEWWKQYEKDIEVFNSKLSNNLFLSLCDSLFDKPIVYPKIESYFYENILTCYSENTFHFPIFKFEVLRYNNDLFVEQKWCSVIQNSNFKTANLLINSSQCPQSGTYILKIKAINNQIDSLYGDIFLTINFDNIEHKAEKFSLFANESKIIEEEKIEFNTKDNNFISFYPLLLSEENLEPAQQINVSHDTNISSNCYEYNSYTNQLWINKQKIKSKEYYFNMTLSTVADGKIKSESYKLNIDIHVSGLSTLSIILISISSGIAICCLGVGIFFAWRKNKKINKKKNSKK